MPNWEGGAQGAMTGASLGAFAGPYGALIGGGLGGALGMFTGGGDPYGEADRRRMMEFEREVAGRQVPLLGQAAQGGVSDFRGDQRDLVSRLQAMASGKGPSLAQEQLRQGVDRATSQQYAMAAGARGNAGLAQRNAMNAAGMLQSQAAQQGAMAGAAEQLGAMSQLGTAAGQGRAMDDQMAQFNAGQTNSFSLANQDAMLRAEQMRDMARLQAMGKGFDMGAYAQQQPNGWDKAGAFAQGLNQTLRANQASNQQSLLPARTTPYGNDTINPFRQAY